MKATKSITPATARAAIVTPSPVTVEAAPTITPAANVRLPRGSKFADYAAENLTTVIIDAVSFHKSQLVEQATRASSTGETVSWRYSRKFSGYSKRETRLLTIAQMAINLERALSLPTA